MGVATWNFDFFWACLIITTPPKSNSQPKPPEKTLLGMGRQTAGFFFEVFWSVSGRVTQRTKFW